MVRYIIEPTRDWYSVLSIHSETSKGNGADSFRHHSCSPVTIKVSMDHASHWQLCAFHKDLKVTTPLKHTILIFSQAKKGTLFKQYNTCIFIII